MVTGARGGIGRQVVQRLRTQGHRVAVVGRDAASLDSLAADARIAADTTEPQGA
ncbi:MAG: SDR family NAD(P)-dependent oxidoreductase, partial [Xylophilus sp.]|nr:SDR family NAD(P)-dependent oxidoreductase [Xylophilus sp.]